MILAVAEQCAQGASIGDALAIAAFMFGLAAILWALSR